MNISKVVYDRFYLNFKQCLAKMDRRNGIDIDKESDRIILFLSDCLIENLSDFESLTKVDKKIIYDILLVLTKDPEELKLLTTHIKLKLCKTKDELKRLLKECELYEYYDLCVIIKDKIRKT